MIVVRLMGWILLDEGPTGRIDDRVEFGVSVGGDDRGSCLLPRETLRFHLVVFH